MMRADRTTNQHCLIRFAAINNLYAYCCYFSSDGLDGILVMSI